MNWEAIFNKVEEDMAIGHIPRAPLQLYLALKSLEAQSPYFWENAAGMEKLLQANPGVNKILSESDSETIAHALKALRYAAAR